MLHFLQSLMNRLNKTKSEINILYNYKYPSYVPSLASAPCHDFKFDVNTFNTF